MKILITGHSKGIWKYLSSDLEKNHEVFGFSRSNWFDLAKKEDIEKIPNNFPPFKRGARGDFQKASVDFQEASWEFLDVLILNAGVWEFGKFEDISLEKYENIINLNLLANIRILKVLQDFIKKDTKIIFVWSIISKKFMKNASVYQASKFALRGFAGGLKSEWKKVFLINPKIVDTDFHKDKIELWNKYPETKLEDILKVVKDIISGEEKRFEIDL